MEETITRGEFIYRLGHALNLEYQDALREYRHGNGRTIELPFSSEHTWLIRSILHTIAKEFSLSPEDFNVLQSIVVSDGRDGNPD